MNRQGFYAHVSSCSLLLTSSSFMNCDALPSDMFPHLMHTSLRASCTAVGIFFEFLHRESINSRGSFRKGIHLGKGACQPSLKYF